MFNVSPLSPVSSACHKNMNWRTNAYFLLLLWSHLISSLKNCLQTGVKTNYPLERRNRQKWLKMAAFAAVLRIYNAYYSLISCLKQLNLVTVKSWKLTYGHFSKMTYPLEFYVLLCWHSTWEILSFLNLDLPSVTLVLALLLEKKKLTERNFPLRLSLFKKGFGNQKV